MTYLRRLEDYCLEKVNEAVTMYSPGNLSARIKSRRYEKYDLSIVVHSPDGHGLRIALAIAIRRLHGDHEGELLLRLGPVHKVSFAASDDCLNRKMGRYASGQSSNLTRYRGFLKKWLV